MKKYYLAVMFALIFLLAMGFAAAELQQDSGDQIDVCWEDNNNGTMVLRNSNDTYSIDVTNIVYNVDDELTVTGPTTPFSISANDSYDLNFEATADILMPGDYDIVIDVTWEMDGTEYNSTFTYSNILEVSACLCGKDVEKDELESFNIREPNNGENFDVGDRVDLELRARADDNIDAELEIYMYDLEEKEYLDIEDIEESVDVDDENTDFEEYYIDLPYDLEEDDNRYLILSRIYNEDDEDDCLEDFTYIDVDKKDHYIVFDKAMLAQDEVECDDYVDLTVRLANAGDKNEDIKLKVSNSELGIDLVQYGEIDDGDEDTFFFSLQIPNDVEEKTYSLRLTAYYDYDNGDDIYEKSSIKLIDLKVQGNCIVPIEELNVNVQQTNSAFSGEDVGFSIIIENTGNIDFDATISVEDYETWATLVNIPSRVSLREGETSIETLVLNVNEEATGIGSFTVKTTYDGQTKETPVSVTISKITEEAGSYDQFAFELKRNLGWFILIIILIIIVIVLIILLAVRPKRRHVVEEPLKKNNNKRKKRR